MKKLLIAVFVFLCAGYSIEYSLRIKALGTDFAYLIPDYETDLTIDPNLLGNKLIGVSYEPRQSMPLMVAALTKRFGWMGKYWFGYRENRSYSYTPNYTNVSIDDSWFLDLRGKLPKFITDNVWNLSNEGRYDSYRYGSSYFEYDTIQSVKYVIKTSDAYKLSSSIKISIRGADGLYIYDSNHGAYGYPPGHHNQWLNFFTIRLGLFYDKILETNKFTSFYLDVGGPTSLNELDGLPYSVLNRVPIDWYDIDLLFFTRNVIGKIAWVNGYPLSEKSFVAIGLVDKCMFQRTEIADSNVYMRGLRNTLTFPVALEIRVGRCAVRAGTRCFYNYNGDMTWNPDYILTKMNEHSLGIGYSFGLQVNLSDDGSVKLDLLNSVHIFAVDDWSVYLKKEW